LDILLYSLGNAICMYILRISLVFHNNLVDTSFYNAFLVELHCFSLGKKEAELYNYAEYEITSNLEIWHLLLIPLGGQYMPISNIIMVS